MSARLAQQREALALANGTRFARARLRRLLKTDSDRVVILALLREPASASDLIGDAENWPDGWLDTMRVTALLESCWRIGPRAAAEIQRRASYHRTASAKFADLTDRERHALADAIETKGGDDVARS